MHIFSHKRTLHIPTIIGTVGLLFHVPGCMALFSILIALIFQEYAAIIPLVALAISFCGSGQILYHVFYHPRRLNLWDAMIIAALGWLFCSLLGAFVHFWIAHSFLSVVDKFPEVKTLTDFTNACFESFSGFTSTGLSIIKNPSKLPHILQWWRSLQEWVGGLGLVLFILSLIEPKREEYRLYFAEAHSEQIGTNMRQTAQKIWIIYIIYTFLFAVLFWLAKVNIWDAINQAMTGISTGGFSTLDNNLEDFPFAGQVIAIFAMIFGSMSFAFHHRVLREKKFSEFWKSKQHVWLFILVIGGSLLAVLVGHFVKDTSSPFGDIFHWISSLSNCGFRIQSLRGYSAIIKLLFIFGMIIGGASGSTTGGIKVRRFLHLFSAIFLRIKDTRKKEKIEIAKKIEKTAKTEKEVSEVKPIKSEKVALLYSATTLFSLWIITLVVGWFILLIWTEQGLAIDTLFDTASALNNVGLYTTFLDASLPSIAKIILIFLMWIGRLEIIPFLVLIGSFFLPFRRSTRD